MFAALVQPSSRLLRFLRFWFGHDTQQLVLKPCSYISRLVTKRQYVFSDPFSVSLSVSRLSSEESENCSLTPTADVFREIAFYYPWRRKGKSISVLEVNRVAYVFLSFRQPCSPHTDKVTKRMQSLVLHFPLNPKDCVGPKFGDD